MHTPIGTMYTPVRSAVKCWPSCNSTGITSRKPNWPIASTIVVCRPYRKLGCSSWLNSKSGSALCRSFARSYTEKVQRIATATRIATGAIEIDRVAGHNNRPLNEKSRSGRNMP
jgi:hypothetical protein